MLEPLRRHLLASKFGRAREMFDHIPGSTSIANGIEFCPSKDETHSGLANGWQCCQRPFQLRLATCAGHAGYTEDNMFLACTAPLDVRDFTLVGLHFERVGSGLDLLFTPATSWLTD